MCPIPDCYKTVARLNNHLRATHKIKDDKQYKEYVKISRTLNIIPEKRSVDSKSEREDEEESELSSSEEAELYKEREGLKKIIFRGGEKYLLRQENEPLSDSDDEDWLFSRVHHHVVLKETSKGN